MTQKKDSFILLNETQRSESVKWSELPITTALLSREYFGTYQHVVTWTPPPTEMITCEWFCAEPAYIKWTNSITISSTSLCSALWPFQVIYLLTDLTLCSLDQLSHLLHFVLVCFYLCLCRFMYVIYSYSKARPIKLISIWMFEYWQKEKLL